jgi:hypothetical protein
MPAKGSELTGYTVTLEVFVPAEVAQRMVDRLDASWRTESWTPAAAAYEVIREALEAAGLKQATSIGTQAVTG